MRAGMDSSVLIGRLQWCVTAGLCVLLAGCQTTAPTSTALTTNACIVGCNEAGRPPASNLCLDGTVCGPGNSSGIVGMCESGACGPACLSPGQCDGYCSADGNQIGLCANCGNSECASRGCQGCRCGNCDGSSTGGACQQCDYSLPRELKKTSLPDYVIEPPDILLIEVTNSLRPPEAPLRAGELVEVRVANTLPVDQYDDGVAQAFKSIDGTFRVQTDGTLNFGPEYGSVPVRGLSISAAQRLVELHLKQTLRNPRVYLRPVTDEARQHIAGEHLVRPDGTVALGVYGSVYVAGLTLGEARQAIERHLSQHLYSPEVSLDVLAYNSKVYYIVTDGGGAGEQVFRFPVTGNETVLDALSQINGLPSVASKKHIWIARPAPANAGYEQVLNVDWNGIVRGAQTATNYQVLPGDRIYVQADNLITFDTGVAKITAPLERILGFVLLGHGTVRAIQFGHRYLGGSQRSSP
ncbi:hypothetical protein GC176_22980 [bacterium]|nr:hypothetical protein [bacterium]